jgi:DivIVA domain-containing protein
MIETNGSAPTDVRGPAQVDHLGRYVRRPFRHALRGYSPEDVDEHLRQVRGWFTLAGFDRLLEERREEILGSTFEEAEETIAHARLEAESIVEDARRRAGATIADAERRLASLKTIARAILDEPGAAA